MCKDRPGDDLGGGIVAPHRIDRDSCALGLVLHVPSLFVQGQMGLAPPLRQAQGDSSNRASKQSPLLNLMCYPELVEGRSA